ncbi:MAG: alpha-ketoglutarate-dependent dioxygenase AlkB [Alphaproteobacteria bacterium]|nr:alpha-ketoglutarate-dependent dioxygenase AlkB [Alphaproteobacteria bacterium]
MTLWPAALAPEAQAVLLRDMLERLEQAPFYRPTMPRTGKAFSVEQSNFGALGWISDQAGYRYEPCHPVTGLPWPAIPPLLLTLWDEAVGSHAKPECCLVNLYRPGARMGLHQDRDEAALDAPVLSLSLGDDALFRIGGTTRRGASQSLRLKSGDLLAFGGPARLAFHGVDRIISAGSSRLIPGGGRLNLTLRRVTPAQEQPGGAKKDARPGG